MTHPPFLLLGAAAALLAVAMGAFGAHGLKSHLSTEMMAIYKTAVDYQMWHALGLILVALIFRQTPANCLYWAGWLMFAGIVLFSGSLYLLAITETRWLGIITPVGGVSFLIAWALLIFFAARQ